MKQPAFDAGNLAASHSSREGRDSADSRAATRRIVLGPIGAALAFLLVAVLASAAAAIISGGAS